jgi:hypothetical protein
MDEINGIISAVDPYSLLHCGEVQLVIRVRNDMLEGAGPGLLDRSVRMVIDDPVPKPIDRPQPVPWDPKTDYAKLEECARELRLDPEIILEMQRRLSDAGVSNPIPEPRPISSAEWLAPLRSIPKEEEPDPEPKPIRFRQWT